MVQIKKQKLIIILYADEPEILLDKIRESLTDVTAILAESDEFYNHREIPKAVGTLIKLLSQLDTTTSRK